MGLNTSIKYYYNFLSRDYGLSFSLVSFYFSKTTFIHSRVSYEYPALANTTELVLVFKMPSYIIYEHYISSNGSLSPDDVSELKDGNFRFVTFKASKFKINKLLPTFTSLNMNLQLLQ